MTQSKVVDKALKDLVEMQELDTNVHAVHRFQITRKSKL